MLAGKWQKMDKPKIFNFSRSERWMPFFQKHALACHVLIVIPYSNYSWMGLSVCISLHSKHVHIVTKWLRIMNPATKGAEKSLVTIGEAMTKRS